MFSIRMKGTDKWVPKSGLQYFIMDDDYYKNIADPTGKGGFSGYRLCPEEMAETFGKKEKYRKVWETTEGMRKSLSHIKGVTTIVYCPASIGGQQLNIGVAGSKKGTIGNFSYYEVVDLISGKIYSLEDVFNKVI